MVEKPTTGLEKLLSPRLIHNRMGYIHRDTRQHLSSNLVLEKHSSDDPVVLGDGGPSDEELGA